MIEARSFQNISLSLGRVGVLGMMVSMPISRALFNLSALLMLLGWIFSGDFGNRFRSIYRNPMAMAAIALFGIVALGGLYSMADVHLIAADILVFSKLLYIPLVWTLLSSSKWLNRAHWAYVAGMMITLLAVYADIWLDIPGTRTYAADLGDDHGVFYHHIAQSMAMSFFTIYALHRGLIAQLRKSKILWLTVAVLATISVTHLSASRTGHLCLLAGFLAAAVVHLPRRRLLVAIPLGLALAAALVLSSSTLQDRFQKGYQEIVDFKFTNDYSSMGARLQMWHISTQLIAEAPILGHGTGSYPQLAKERFADDQMCSIGCPQPHNQFMFTGVENGLVGVLFLLVFMASPVYAAYRKQIGSLRLAIPLVAIMLMANLFDSALLIRPEGYFFISALALVMSTHFRNAKPEPTYGTR